MWMSCSRHPKSTTPRIQTWTQDIQTLSTRQHTRHEDAMLTDRPNQHENSPALIIPPALPPALPSRSALAFTPTPAPMLAPAVPPTRASMPAPALPPTLSPSPAPAFTPMSASEPIPTPALTSTPSPPTPATRSSLAVTKRARRSKINGKGRQKKLHRRRFYTNQFKQDVLEFYNTSKDIAATITLRFPRADASGARSSERKLVYKWNARRDQIATSSQPWRTATQSRSRDLGLGTTLPADTEQLLVKWINDY